MFAVGFVSPFPQEVSGAFNRGISTNELVSEKSPRCTTCFQQPVQPLNLIRARSRCNKVAFMPLLAFAATALLAQTVLTLGFVVPDMGKLIEAGSNGTKAVTGENHIVTSGFALITLIQLIFGTYLTGVTAPEGGESTTECLPQYSPTSTLQRNQAHISRLRPTRCASSGVIGRGSL